MVKHGTTATSERKSHRVKFKVADRDENKIYDFSNSSRSKTSRTPNFVEAATRSTARARRNATNQIEATRQHSVLASDLGSVAEPASSPVVERALSSISMDPSDYLVDSMRRLSLSNAHKGGRRMRTKRRRHKKRTHSMKKR